MVYFKDKPPWEVKVNPQDSGTEQQRKAEQAMEIKEKETKAGGKWAKWEEGRKKSLRERRDYFRKNPNKEDDFGGV